MTEQVKLSPGARADIRRDAERNCEGATVADTLRLLDDYDALQCQVNELTSQRDAILLQARCWAGEAKAQQAITREVGAILGGIPDWGAIAAGVEELRSQLEAARGLLREAAEDVESWGAYASAYFQEKHDLAGCVMKYRMAGTGDQEDGGAEQAAIAAMPLTATHAPEVQASGPYVSVADALAQRYPKPSLLKDCNVTYSNSSRPLAEQGERKEAWANFDEMELCMHKPAAGTWVKVYTSPPPTQDVSGLVEALEGMLEYFPEGHSDGECFSVERAKQALAAHRNPATVKRCPTCTGTCAEICAKARP